MKPTPTSTPSARPIQSRPRRVVITLRDGDVVEGGLFLTTGQALAPYLGSRKSGWVNIVSATWHREGELHGHAVLHTDHIVIAASPDRDTPVQFPTPGAVARRVDISLDDGTRIRGNLHLAQRQRLSDYLAGCGSFLPLLDAYWVADEEPLGDIAVNSGCVKAVRDAKVFVPAKAGAEAAIEPWGGMRRGSGAVPVVGAVARRTPESGAAITTAHWLMRLASDAHLAVPDVADLPAVATLADLWSAIADGNDMAEGELAHHVATAHSLEVANLDDATPEALRHVPLKLARRLGVLPLKVDGRNLSIAVSEPASFEVEQQLGFVCKLTLREAIATPADIAGAISWHYAMVPAAAG